MKRVALALILTLFANAASAQDGVELERARAAHELSLFVEELYED